MRWIVVLLKATFLPSRFCGCSPMFGLVELLAAQQPDGKGKQDKAMEFTQRPENLDCWSQNLPQQWH